MLDFVAQWGHAAAAALFAAVAAWTLRDTPLRRAPWLFVIGCLSTALWALLCATTQPQSGPALVMEALRNLSWLALMFSYWRRDGHAAGLRSVKAIYLATAMVGALHLFMAIGHNLVPADWPHLASAEKTLFLIALIFPASAMVLAHNLYTAGTADTRQALRLSLTALSIMWVYDFNLYLISYLGGVLSPELVALRGLVTCIVAPLFGLSAKAAPGLKVRMSRTATFQSIGLGVFGFYIAAIMVLNTSIKSVLGTSAETVQVALFFSLSLASLVLLPSARFRAWFRVKVTKHLFQHRYDYREEWLRFSETLGKAGEVGTPLQTRVVQALADVTDSQSGLLLSPDDLGQLRLGARWNWASADVALGEDTAQAIRFFEQTGRIIELDELRTGAAIAGDERGSVPAVLLDDPQAWVIIPLIHFEKLAGLVVLGRPLAVRKLDWEDFDLLRIMGRQIATYLAEARGQDELATAQRFEDFNRRFAFVMHDIKNLVSQLALVARNAEKHAGNPEFQTDMRATLHASVARMNDLLARLSKKESASVRLETGDARALLEAVARSKQLHHDIRIEGEAALAVWCDLVRVEQALDHLVQNAIDASPADVPIKLRLDRVGSSAVISVVDHGRGMSAQFIQTELFKPFASTKPGGFGIGAFEARSHIVSCGGQLDVTSGEGAGTTFRIRLMLAGAHVPTTPLGAKLAAGEPLYPSEERSIPG